MKLCRLVKLSKIERSLELIIIIHNEIKIFGIEKHMAASYPAVYKQENIKFLGIGTINNNIDSLINDTHISLLNAENLFILGKGKMEYFWYFV